MKLRFYDMIDLYIEKEKEKFYREIEVLKRGILEYFAYFMDGIKQKVWSIDEITGEDGRSYYRKLLSEKPSLTSVERHIQIINNFMEFAINQGWIEERPWTRLFESTKSNEGHFRLSEEERTGLIEYVKSLSPDDYPGKRDKAVMLLYLSYRLRKTEVSGLNTVDYSGKSLRIKSPFTWRERDIPLSRIEISSVDEYLVERMKRKNVKNGKALFLGKNSGRLSPGMVKKIIESYLTRIKEN